MSVATEAFQLLFVLGSRRTSKQPTQVGDLRFKENGRPDPTSEGARIDHAPPDGAKDGLLSRRLSQHDRGDRSHVLARQPTKNVNDIVDRACVPAVCTRRFDVELELRRDATSDNHRRAELFVERPTTSPRAG